MRNKAVFLFFLGFWFLWNVSAWAGPLELLSELGELARKAFYRYQKEEIAAHLKDKKAKKLSEICNKLPEKITFELREYLGEGKLKVEFFSLNYVDVANLPPYPVQEAILSMQEQHQMEGKYQPRILIIEEREGHDSRYAFVVPLVNQKSCLLCHGQGAPYGTLFESLYPEKRSLPEKEGDLRGVLVIYVSPKVLKKVGTLKAGL